MMCVYEISSGIGWLKNLVNWCTFAEVMMKSQMYWFFYSQCTTKSSTATEGPRDVLRQLTAPLKLRPYGAIQMCILLSC